MSEKKELSSGLTEMVNHGNDIYAFVKEGVDKANEFGLYMIPCIRHGQNMYYVSSNVPIPSNSLVQIRLRHFSQFVKYSGGSFKSHQYSISIKDPVIIPLA